MSYKLRKLRIMNERVVLNVRHFENFKLDVFLNFYVERLHQISHDYNFVASIVLVVDTTTTLNGRPVEITLLGY